VRGLVIVVAVIVGMIVVSGVIAAIDNGRDYTGQTVPVRHWADDVCGTTGAWEGQIEDIRDELRLSNFAARRSDGGSGDSVEETISLRQAVDRAISATHQTLHTGLLRAGIPSVNAGNRASSILSALKTKPTSPAEAFQLLVAPAQALARSAVDGRASFKDVGQLDPDLADALSGSRNCRDLMKEKP
jgi:hypothetical protein